MILHNKPPHFIVQKLDESDFSTFGNPVMQDGSTLLHVAVKQGQLTIVKRLLEAGQVIDCQDEKGNTPLHYANMYGNLYCIDLL